MLLTYFVTIHLVPTPRIAVLLHHSEFFVVDDKVIKMERLNESQLIAQAVRLFEGNYSYSVIGKRLGRSKVWVSKWIKALEDEFGGIFAK